MKDLVKRSVKGIVPYKVKQETYNIKLDANENPYNIFKDLREPIQRRLMDLQINRYPDSDSLELKKLLSNYTGVGEEGIICGNGSDEIIKFIIDAFIDKEDIVVTFKPTFSMYRITTEIAGGKVIEIESDRNFDIDIDQIIKESNDNKAKVIFLCNPNNPTGKLIKRVDILKVLKNTESVVVVDEAYYEFSKETVIDLVDEYSNLIVLRTLSKGLGLAGIRLGYGLGSRAIIEILNKVKSPYNLNGISQAIGEVVLKNRQRVDKYIDEINRERDYLIKEISLMENIEAIQSSSNFILIRTDNASRLVERFQEKKIAIRDFGDNGSLKNCIRITIGSKEEDKTILDILKDVALWEDM